MDKMKLPPKTEEFIKERLKGADYEVHPSQLVDKYIQEWQIVLEGGAGLGVVTERIAANACFVFAYEAHPELFRCARQNVRAENALVKQGTLTFKSYHIPHTGKAFGVEPMKMSQRIDPNGIIRLEGIDALVLDVEGEEANILLNIVLDPLELIIVEMHPIRAGWGPLEAANSRLQRKGFRKAENIADGDILHVVYIKGYSDKIKPLRGDPE